MEDKITPATVAALDVIWEAEVDGWVRSPLSSTKGVHASTYRGVYGFDTKTGEQLWSHQGPDLWGPATYVHETVWSTDKDVLWAGGGTEYGVEPDGQCGYYETRLLDAATGEIAAGAPPGVGFVDGVRGQRYLLRTVRTCGQSGPPVLGVTVGGPSPQDVWSVRLAVDGYWSPLTLGKDHVYQAGQGVFLPQDGSPVDGSGVRAYEIGAEAEQCRTEVLRLIVPCPTWVTPVDEGPAMSPVLSRDEATLFTAAGRKVYALDAATGDILWTTPVGSLVGAEPALADGRLYVPVRDGLLVALDATNGKILWKASIGDFPDVQPAVAGGVVFTGATDGSVHAFDAAGCGAKTCSPLWSASTGSRITGAPAVSNGQLYVGTLGRLVAYGLP